VIVAERLHQRCRFFYGIVIADLRAKNRGLDRSLIAHTIHCHTDAIKVNLGIPMYM